MKTLACQDIGMDCPFITQGETEEEVVKKEMEHFKTAHIGKLSGMTEDEIMTMQELMHEKIKDI